MPGGGLAVGGGFGTLAIIVVAMLLGVNPVQFLQQVAPPPGAVADRGGGAAVADSPLQEFTEVILKDTEDVWNTQFRAQLGQEYDDPTLVFFGGEGVRSGCGFASSDVGPFYCPADSKVYLDLRFFHTLSEQLGATGDAAMAYVIAHEVGHHVQNLLGIHEQVQRSQGRMSQVEANQMSVRTELQADYLAGVFFHHAQRSKQILESGDIEEALNAAKQIGDDVLTKGQTPESMFTHGKGESRMKWLRRGMQTGSVARQDLMAPFEIDYDSL